MKSCGRGWAEPADYCIAPEFIVLQTFQGAGYADAGETFFGTGETLKESVERDERRKELQKQIAALQVKVRRER